MEYFLLLDEQGEAQGYIKLNYGKAQTDFMGDEYTEVERIYVKKSAKRKGLGRRMMDFACQAARSRKKTKLWLGVWMQNPKAIAFYQNYGMIKKGEHDFIMGEEVQKDWIMELSL